MVITENLPNDITDYSRHNSWYNEALIYNQYGYWQDKRSCLPDRYTEAFFTKASEFALSLKPHKIELWYKLHDTGGSWKIYDTANKNIYWENSVGGCSSSENAKRYILSHGTNYVNLYTGVVDALLMYKNTGIACRPNWNHNKIDPYGYKDGIRNYVPRCEEVEL